MNCCMNISWKKHISHIAVFFPRHSPVPRGIKHGPNQWSRRFPRRLPYLVSNPFRLPLSLRLEILELRRQEKKENSHDNFTVLFCLIEIRLIETFSTRSINPILVLLVLFAFCVLRLIIVNIMSLLCFTDIVNYNIPMWDASYLYCNQFHVYK